MAMQKGIILTATVTTLIAGILLCPSGATCQDKKLQQMNPGVVEALGELIRDMNTLQGGKKGLPEDNNYSESIRNKYGIPARVPILAPHGGNEIIAFVFASESLCMVQGEYVELEPTEYKYLQSLHNMKSVYTLFDKEPVTLGNTVYAFEKAVSGSGVTVFFNDKGKLRSVTVQAGNSICIKDSPFIVRPVTLR